MSTLVSFLSLIHCNLEEEVISSFHKASRAEKNGVRLRLFPFRKRSLPFLTVDAIIGNQAFCHGRCNICSGLSHNKVTNTFLNSLRKNKV